mmetsp:Transcript_11014/g.18404  ORF Transcript_11014/g.18404 Transcript_11014/m.18404 type:complete len:128 (-) Transcript_11014:86-469(-)
MLSEDEEEVFESEVFRDIHEEKPTPCLVLKNIVKVNENMDAEDYKELEFDISEEIEKYGKVKRVHVPRPPRYGDPYMMKGFGKAYAMLETDKDALNAKNKLFNRRFNNRFVEVYFYPEHKFTQNLFE